MRTLTYFFLLLVCLACTYPERDGPTLVSAPAGDRYCGIDPAGETIIPNGRIIRPLGTTVRVAPHPFGLALSPDGRTAVTANSGTRPFSVSILEGLDGTPTVRQIPEGYQNDEGVLESVFMGLAITPDNQSVYVAGGQSNKIFRFDLASGNKLDSIDCAVSDGDQDYTDGYLGDLRLSRDGRRLYAVDQVGFRLLIIDTEDNVVLHNVPTGRYPFGLALSPKEDAIYVANVGMFEYSYLDGLTPENAAEKAIGYPVSAYGSEEMREGVTTDSFSAPGLGDPNAPESFSVWRIELSDSAGAEPYVSQRIKTGVLVGEPVDGIPAVGGASPNSLVANDHYVFVTNGNNDSVSAIEVDGDTVVHTIQLRLPEPLQNTRGIIPFGLALSPDGKRLYVAESGINAVAVIDAESLEVLGHLPVGWFPSKLAVSPDGRQLIVANAKGYGSGPNGGPAFDAEPRGSYIGNLMQGSVTTLDIPPDEALDSLTTRVLAQNFRLHPADEVERPGGHPIPIYPGERESPIKHLVFISKENRTYDEVFGQLKSGRGEPTLARYGVDRNFSSRDSIRSAEGITVMPNHLNLARRYAISDNFYVDADVSADGHRWLVNTYPNEWTETHVAAAYGGKRRFQPLSQAPGKFGMVGSSGAIYPEDYNEAGSLWEHLDRGEVSFFNFGFGVETAGTIADSTLAKTGVRYLVNYPIPGPLYDRSSRNYATYNMAIPDQFRADQFISEFTQRWLDGEEEMPQVITLILPNDHGAGDRPHAGYPFKESYMMDNDLALGRIIEFLSQTPYWKNMAIVITEDDAQDGRDHIDAHRSLLMVVSPYAKRRHIGHGHYSFGSIFKTFWHVLGLPYQNQYDAGATDLAELFTDEPDFTPYEALPVDSSVFDPQRALDPFDADFDWEAINESPQLDAVEDFLKRD